MNKLLVAILVVGWGALFVSKAGVLVWQSGDSAAGYSCT
jgi:hypothetical protein